MIAISDETRDAQRMPQKRSFGGKNPLAVRDISAIRA
jgi:hypothetical protein